MKLKMDEQGHAVVEDGMPVFVYDDGRELPFDAPRAVAMIKKTSDERDAARETLGGFEKLKGHKIDDLLAAAKTVKALDEKKLIEAGKVEEVVAERLKAAQEAWLAKETEFKSSLEAEQAKVRSLVVSRRFADSKILKDKVTASVTPRVAEALFGGRFKVEGDRPVPLDDAGKPIYSKVRPGEVADFDEGLEIMISTHPDAGNLLKSNAGSGPAAAGSSGAKADGSTALPPVERLTQIFTGATH